METTSKIISINVHNLSFKESMRQIIERGQKHQPGFVCFTNVHMIIEAYYDAAFQKDLKKATLMLPDGKPVALACKWLYKKPQERIAGMDFMPALFEETSKINGKVFLFGSTPEVLEKLTERIHQDYAGTQVVGAISPPFRKLSEEESNAFLKQINDSGAQYVLVALGCPKQEKWMAQNYQHISAVLLGLGGVFPVMAGTQKRCPRWMSNASLEWLFRLIQEPRRLFKRYFYTNTRFLYLLFRQMSASLAGK